MIRKGVKASYHYDKEELKRRLINKHNQRRISYSTAYMDAFRGVEKKGDFNLQGGGEGGSDLHPELTSSASSSAAIVSNSYDESTMNSNHLMLLRNSCNGMRESGMHDSSPMVAENEVTKSGNACPPPGNDGWQLQSDRLSTEEWTCFLDELGCSLRTPEFLGYLLDLEEEIRNDMLFELYDTTQQAEVDIGWQEYYSLLSS